MESVSKIVNKYDNDPGMLISMMHDIQAESGYLPAAELKELSTIVQVPLTRIFGIATFYSSFRLAPKGQHEVSLCIGTDCFNKGAGTISAAICKEFNVVSGETTADGLFSFQAVNCIGACSMAPVMVVDGKYHDGVTTDSAIKVIQNLSNDSEKISKESDQ